MAIVSTLAPFGGSALKLLCACVLTLSVSSAFAQQHPSPPPQVPPRPPPKAAPPPADFPSANNPWDQNELIQRNNNKLVSPMIAEGDNCFLPPLNGLLRFNVGIADLQVPAKAQREHKEGCAALRQSKTIEAEGHLRKAVKQWPKDLAAWVVLGQLLEAQQKSDEAYGACSQPLATDSNYLPAYLCLADISAHSESWTNVLQLSTRALEIDPTNNAVAYDYNAAANFHLHRLPEAESSALRAAEIDKSNADPRVHFLLAQIYEAKGDRESEAAQLREYLKYVINPNEVVVVRGYLSKLELPVSSAAAQSSPEKTQPEVTTNPGTASLKICLRLADETRFAGTAEVHVIPSEGYEVLGAPTGKEGELLFPEISPGTYIVEARAPGYLSLRLHTQIEAVRGQRTIYVVMKPKPVPKRTETALIDAPPENLKSTPERAASPSAPAEPARSEERDYWRAHELEESAPPVDANVECPAQEVLRGVAQRMVEFVGNLEKFTATESVEHTAIDPTKESKAAEVRKFDYVVTVTQNREGTFLLSEYRNGNTDPELFPAHVATQGVPALDLLFHPLLAGDFKFVCEGLGAWGARAAWQIHFAQRPDRPVRLRAYVVTGRVFTESLEGRAWIDPASYQVMRLETELAKPIPEIELTKEHVTIDYEPVQFQMQKLQIWLPHAAELYVERRGHRYYRRHTFTDFKIFNVDTAQAIQGPQQSYVFTNLSEQDISGILTVEPDAGAKHEKVSVKFTVPAGAKISKVVGLGKDVNLPATEVASATFLHNGKDGAISVEADLGRETTLDVIEQQPVPQM